MNRRHFFRDMFGAACFSLASKVMPSSVEVLEAPGAPAEQSCEDWLDDDLFGECHKVIEEDREAIRKVFESDLMEAMVRIKHGPPLRNDSNTISEFARNVEDDFREKHPEWFA